VSPLSAIGLPSAASVAATRGSLCSRRRSPKSASASGVPVSRVVSIRVGEGVSFSILTSCGQSSGHRKFRLIHVRRIVAVHPTERLSAVRAFGFLMFFGGTTMSRAATCWNSTQTLRRTRVGPTAPKTRRNPGLVSSPPARAQRRSRPEVLARKLRRSCPTFSISIRVRTC
jgi:hypothetical protein